MICRQSNFVREFNMLRFAALPLLLAAAPASFQDTALIDQAVQNFTGRPVGAEGGARTPVDARLRLAACPMVSLNWMSDTHDAVVVSCTAPAWKIYVPVVSAPRAMPAAGAPVRAAAPVATAPVIKRGDPVTVSANAAGFAITREGVAMGDAAPGARFLVDMDGSRKGVQAVAIAAGQAILPGYEP
jgi:flagellar basal body P-ring formation protein FlgA